MSMVSLFISSKTSISPRTSLISLPESSIIPRKSSTVLLNNAKSENLSRGEAEIIDNKPFAPKYDRPVQLPLRALVCWAPVLSSAQHTTARSDSVHQWPVCRLVASAGKTWSKNKSSKQIIAQFLYFANFYCNIIYFFEKKNWNHVDFYLEYSQFSKIFCTNLPYWARISFSFRTPSKTAD